MNIINRKKKNSMKYLFQKKIRFSHFVQKSIKKKQQLHTTTKMTSFFICCNTKKSKPNSRSQSQMSAIVKEKKEVRPQKKMINESFHQSTQNTCILVRTPESKRPIIEQNDKMVRSLDDVLYVAKKLLNYRRDQFVPSVKKESEYISKLISDTTDDRFLVSIGWAKLYTQFLNDPVAHTMTEIDNRGILKDEIHKSKNTVIKKTNHGDLRAGLKVEVNYVLLNEKTWKFIRYMYGGGPEILIESHDLENQSCVSGETVQNLQKAPSQESDITQIIQDKKTSVKQADVKVQKSSRFLSRDIPLQQTVQQNVQQTVKQYHEQQKIQELNRQEQRQQEMREQEQKQQEQQKNQQAEQRREDILRRQVSPSVPIEDALKKRDQIQIVSKNEKSKQVSYSISYIWELRSQELPVVGLVNQRFFCYMNSALQCMMSVTQLNYFYVSGQASKQKGSKQKSFSTAYEDLLRWVEMKGGKRVPVFQAQRLQQLSAGKFNGFEQHDAHEFLLHILSELQEEVSIKTKLPECKTAGEALINYFQAHNNTVDMLFAGQLTSCIYCPKCSTNSHCFDPTFDLQLPIKKQSFLSTDCSLEECLNLYFKEEMIDDFWKCGQCSKSTNRVKRFLKISHSPNILVILFKRFTLFPRKEKIRDNVTYLRQLDIKNYCTQEVKQTKYQLISIIVHSGGINGGHYYAYTKRQGNWYCFNDDFVEKVSENDALSQRQAYVLFYEKIKQ